MVSLRVSLPCLSPRGSVWQVSGQGGVQGLHLEWEVGQGAGPELHKLGISCCPCQWRPSQEKPSALAARLDLLISLVPGQALECHSESTVCSQASWVHSQMILRKFPSFSDLFPYLYLWDR